METFSGRASGSETGLAALRGAAQGAPDTEGFPQSPGAESEAGLRGPSPRAPHRTAGRSGAGERAAKPSRRLKGGSPGGPPAQPPELVRLAALWPRRGLLIQRLLDFLSKSGHPKSVGYSSTSRIRGTFSIHTRRSVYVFT